MFSMTQKDRFEMSLTVVALLGTVSSLLESNHCIPGVVIESTRDSVTVSSQVKGLSHIRKCVSRA